ncbi:hypothetical protein [Leucobacter sp. gxy201]|uniref:hypothetical protein n=1 Tax=Leucobacter sp. gxy201 TaxID=2957200 RepID=UPI003DA117FA
MTEITRIDPDLPLCWEDADTVRIGFERAAARIVRPPAAVQRLLGALCTGIPTRKLREEARKRGVSPRDYRDLMSALGPALRRERALRGGGAQEGAPPRLRLVVSDEGREAPGLRTVLGALEHCDVDAEARAEKCDLVVHVERYLEPLERAQRWRAMGVPHLLLRFSDRVVQIGPIVEPDGSPCHSCVSLGLVARDPALPVLAIQLHGKVPRSETAAASEAAAAYISRLVRDWRAGAAAARRTRWVIPVVHGRPVGPAREESVPPHPGCSCRDPIETDFASGGAGAAEAAPVRR